MREQGRVRPVIQNAQREREFFRVKLLVRRGEFFGDGHDFVVLGVGGIDDHQFVGAKILGVIPGLSFGQPHRAFGGEGVGQQLADQQEDDAEVDEQDADFFLRQLETRGVGSQQVRHQQRSQQVAAGQQNRPLVIADGRPPDQPALEVARLRLVKPFMHLRQRAHKDEQQPGAQQHDGQPKRGQRFDKSIKHSDNARIGRT